MKIIKKIPYQTVNEMVYADIVGMIHIPFWCFWWSKWKRKHAVIIIKDNREAT